MTHHGIVEHFSVQEELFPQYVVDNWEQVSATLADAGMHIAFTGHFHSQDAAKTTTDEGNTIYDIETGSLVTYPSPYREVELTEDEMNVSTEYVTDIDYDTDGQRFQEYSREYLANGMQELIPNVLTTMAADKTGVPESLLQPQVEELVNIEVAEDFTLLDLATDAIMQHYAGDEQAGEKQQEGIQTLLDFDNELLQMFGAALQELYNDPTPDNNFSIDLNTLSNE